MQMGGGAGSTLGMCFMSLNYTSANDYGHRFYEYFIKISETK